MKIMNMMPFFIMAYISLTGRGYFDVMYHNLPGIIVMSVCLIVYIFSYLWGVRIFAVKA
jgi:tight adherence protein B